MQLKDLSAQLVYICTPLGHSTLEGYVGFQASVR